MRRRLLRVPGSTERRDGGLDVRDARREDLFGDLDGFAEG
jgi:hypothetical protein